MGNADPFDGVHRTHRHRRLYVIAAVAALAVVIGLLVWSYTRPEPGGRKTPAVASYILAASPDEVVLTYLAALTDHDIGTARSLLSPEHAAYVDGAEDSWFRNVVSITEIRVDPPALPSVPGTAGYSETTRVNAHFVLKQKRAMSLNDGEMSWGYVLGRTPGAPWVILDEGNG